MFAYDQLVSGPLSACRRQTELSRTLAPWSALAALSLFISGCLINPVPTPGEGPPTESPWSAAADATLAGDIGDWGAEKDAGASDAGGGAADAGPWWRSDSAAEADAGAAAYEDAWWGGEDAAPGDASAADGGTVEEDGGSLEPGGPQSWKAKGEAKEFAMVNLGGDKTLELVDMRVTVKVEGLRVRTLVDHIFYNPHDQAAEGEFRYALPTGASISYYAMFVGTAGGGQPQFFGNGDGLQGADDETVANAAPDEVAKGADSSVWGTLREAKVVAKVTAQKAYESETEKKIDPALVEQVAPNTFSAKVFPIMAKGYNRVLVAYEETLTRVGTAPNHKLEYLFPVPLGPVGSFEFTLVALAKHVQSSKLVSTEIADVKETQTTGAYIAHKLLQDNGPGKPLVFHFDGLYQGPEHDLVAGTDPVLQQAYVGLRLQPKVAALKDSEGGAPLGIFLIDTSHSEHPARFQLSMKLLQGILKASPEMKDFGVITFDAGARWLKSGWYGNDDAGRKAALAAFDDVLLEGATDVSAALRALSKPPVAVPQGTDADVFLLSDGALNWGEQGLDAMVARYAAETPFDGRFFAYRTGLGAENAALYQALTGKGAIFNCTSDSAMVDCYSAHASSGMTIESVTIKPDGPDGAQVTDLLVAGQQATLFPGAQMWLAGKLISGGKANVVIKGKIAGKPQISHTIPVLIESQPSGELAPRAWAEIAVAQLSATHVADLEVLAMALSQHYRIASSLASFLVLEKDSDYDKYDIKDLTTKYQGQTINWMIDKATALGSAAWSSWMRLQKLIADFDSSVKLLKVDGGDLLSKLTKDAKAEDLELPVSNLLIPLVGKAGIPGAYFTALNDANPYTTAPYATEAIRRRKMGDLGAAVRALSTAVERNPGKSEVARMVGYRLQAWNHLPLAAGVLYRVLLARPLEPQSWRDLANVLWTTRPALAAALYEAALSGTWPNKFGSMKVVVKEEYSQFMAALAKTSPGHPLLPYLAERKKAHKLTTATGDLRVTITWNTNNVDIDLWVTDPTGEKCYYQHKSLTNGGKLLEDLTDGFGPEQFVVTKAMPGTWKIEVKYFGNNGNKLVAETCVQVTVQTHAGTPDEDIQRHVVVMTDPKVVTKVDEVTFK